MLSALDRIYSVLTDIRPFLPGSGPQRPCFQMFPTEICILTARKIFLKQQMSRKLTSSLPDTALTGEAEARGAVVPGDIEEDDGATVVAEDGEGAAVDVAAAAEVAAAGRGEVRVFPGLDR